MSQALNVFWASLLKQVDDVHRDHLFAFEIGSFCFFYLLGSVIFRGTFWWLKVIFAVVMTLIALEFYPFIFYSLFNRESV